MSSSEALKDALQDLKEAFLVRIARTYISRKIPDGEILMLARTRLPSGAIKQLKRNYPMSYLWNKMRRAHRAWRNR